MATVKTVVCDCCNTPLKKDAPQYSWRMRQINIVSNFDRLPFMDVCAKCNAELILRIGGSRTTWSQEELEQKDRTELREIAKQWQIKGRDKDDLVSSLIGKLISGPEEEHDDAPTEVPKGKK